MVEVIRIGLDPFLLLSIRDILQPDVINVVIRFLIQFYGLDIVFRQNCMNFSFSKEIAHVLGVGIFL